MAYTVCAAMNLSPRVQLTAMIVLALIGLGISGYLAYLYLNHAQIPCTTNWLSGCDAVQQSPYAQILGVPIPVFGTLYYLFVLVDRLFLKKWHTNKTWHRLFWLALIVGVGFSAYLTLLEAFVIRAWCVWCVGSAITATALFIVWLIPVRPLTAVFSGPPQPLR